MTKSLTLLSLLALVSPGLAWKAGSKCSSSYSYINYTTVPGFFLQDDASTPSSGFDYATVSLGLINQTYPTDPTPSNHRQRKTQWERFTAYVEHLNSQSPDEIAYKVLFLGRHGEGYHNAAETYYGTPAWNCYWSELDGNGTSVWADALLTPAGEAQAVKAHNFWKDGMAKQKIPAPETYYTSPLSRCLVTANLTFAGLDLPKGREFVPVVKEFLREGVSIHTCDRRRSRSDIHDLYPGYQFESGFAEADTLWNGLTAEDSGSQFARSKIVLDEIFEEDEGTWISVTSHSGEISSLLSVLGHRVFGLGTGQVIPVLVKAERVARAYPTKTIGGWTSQATCAGPPVTSLAGTGCVCTGAVASPTMV